MKIYIPQLNTEKYIDAWLYSRLMLIKKGVHTDNRDAVFLSVGHEGEGKSCYTAQIAAVMNNEFCLKHVYWDADKLIETVNSKHIPVGTALMLDEADLVMSNQTMQRELQKKLILLLKTCRSKNLILFFVGPSWFDFNRYIAKHRPNYLFMIDSKKNQRGFWYSWPRKVLPVFWKKAYPSQDMRAMRPLRYGRFTHWWPFDEAEYERKKKAELRRLFGGEVTEDDHKLMVKKSLSFYDNNGLLVRGAKKKLTEILKVSKRTISTWVANI